MNNRKIIQALVFFFLSLLLSIFLANLVIPKASSKLTAEDSTKVEQPSLYYLAVGDSLTEGVFEYTENGEVKYAGKPQGFEPYSYPSQMCEGR